MINLHNVKGIIIMKRAITALTLSLAASTLSFAEGSIDTDVIMAGLKDTKLIFSCDHPDAKVMFQITEEARVEVMYTLTEAGTLVAEENLQNTDKQCPNDTQIAVDDYCVQPICVIKDVRPPVKPQPNPTRSDFNAAQLEQKPVSLEEIF